MKFYGKIPQKFIKYLPPDIEQTVKDNDLRFLVMQCHINFKNYLDVHHSSFSNVQLIWFCSEIGNALKFLAENKIVHRDLKLEDILLSVDGFPIICDFGKAEFVDFGKLENQQKNGKGGNLGHLAPEVLNTTLDIIDYSKQPSWELGVISHEISVLQHPFPEYPSNISIYGKSPFITVPSPSCQKLELMKFPRNFIKLVSKLLLNDPKERPDIISASRELEEIVNAI